MVLVKRTDLRFGNVDIFGVEEAALHYDVIVKHVHHFADLVIVTGDNVLTDADEKLVPLSVDTDTVNTVANLNPNFRVISQQVSPARVTHHGGFTYAGKRWNLGALDELCLTLVPLLSGGGGPRIAVGALVLVLLSALAYGLQALDAYVSAELADFDVSEDLSLRLVPTPTGPAAALRWSF